MPDDLTDKIEEAAQKPLEVMTDGVRVQGRDLRELIEADRYLKNGAAASAPRRGLRFSKLVPPGTS